MPILEGECKDCALERVSIQPGCEWSPDVYKLEEHNQVFLFMSGTGYVKTPRMVYNITAVSYTHLDVYKRQCENCQLEIRKMYKIYCKMKLV